MKLTSLAVTSVVQPKEESNRWSASEPNRVACGGSRAQCCVRGPSASLSCLGMASTAWPAVIPDQLRGGEAGAALGGERLPEELQGPVPGRGRTPIDPEMDPEELVHV